MTGPLRPNSPRVLAFCDIPDAPSYGMRKRYHLTMRGGWPTTKGTEDKKL